MDAQGGDGRVREEGLAGSECADSYPTIQAAVNAARESGDHRRQGLYLAGTTHCIVIDKSVVITSRRARSVVAHDHRRTGDEQLLEPHGVYLQHR
jgi:hypothetical protein